MKNSGKKCAVIIAASFFITAGALIGCGGQPPAREAGPAEKDESELRGRDFVRLGEFTAVTGELRPYRGEWFLISGNDTYEIHLGDHGHRASTGINLREGKTAAVTGYLYGQEGAEAKDIAVCTVTIDGIEYRFREDDGTPLWRGQSSGGGQGEEAPAQSGQGRGGGHRR